MNSITVVSKVETARFIRNTLSLYHVASLVERGRLLEAERTLREFVSYPDTDIDNRGTAAREALRHLHVLSGGFDTCLLVADPPAVRPLRRLAKGAVTIQEVAAA